MTIVRRMDKAERAYMGGIIRERRKAEGLTQKQLAGEIGIHAHETISNLENGRAVPSLMRLSALGKRLKVPLWRFLTPQRMVPAPEQMRPDEAAILETAAQLSEPDLRAAREMLEVFLRTRG